MGWKRKIVDLLGVLAFCAAVGIVGSRCWRHLRPAEAPHHPVRSALADFQDVMYYPTRAALAGVNPYDARPAADGGVYYARFPAGNSFPLYAPLVFIPSLPFAMMPLVPAEICYWMFNLVLLLLYAWVALRLAKLPVSAGSLGGLAAVLLISRPGHANFYFGALALPLSLATFGSWYFAERRPWLSAACLAVACIKPTFGGPLVLLMLLGRKHRALVLGVFITVVVNVVVFAAFLPNEFFHPRPLEMLAHNQAVIDDDPAVDPLKSSSRVDFPYVVERIWGQHFPGYVRFGITLLMIAIAGWQIRKLSVEEPVGRRFQTALACLTIGICIYHNIYDALMVVIPAAAAWGALSRRGASKALPWTLALLFAIPAVNYFSSRQFLKFVADTIPSLSETQPGTWTLICVLNGVSLTLAWCLLLTAAKNGISKEPEPATPV